MTIYCTLEEYEGLCPTGISEVLSLFDPDDDGFANTTMYEAHAMAAANDINDAIGRRYQTPIDPIPPKVRWIAYAITRWSVMGDDVTEIVKEHYQVAQRMLQQYSDGTRDVHGGNGESEKVSSYPTPVIYDPASTAMVDSLKSLVDYD